MDDGWLWMTTDDYWWRWMILNDYGWLCMTIDDHAWLWTIMDDYGWLWMTMDGSGWFWMTMDGSGWFWMTMDDYGWFWMTMDDCGWFWVTMDEYGWLWMTTGGSGWLWMNMDDYGWLDDCGTLSLFLSALSRLFSCVFRWAGRPTNFTCAQAQTFWLPCDQTLACARQHGRWKWTHPGPFDMSVMIQDIRAVHHWTMKLMNFTTPKFCSQFCSCFQ